MRFLINLQSIDRRIVYVLLAVVVGLFLWWDPIHQKLPVTPEVKGVYTTIEKLAKENAKLPEGQKKIAVISVFWNAGTLGENKPQTMVVAKHLFKEGVPFAVLPFDQMGTQLAYNAIDSMAKDMGKTYGKDWIAFGWQPLFDQTLQALTVDVPGRLKKDRNGTPVNQIPMMKGIKTARDFGMVLEVTGSGTVGSWISYVGQPLQVPIAYAPTGVMVPDGYNLLDAKQICGMLPGLIGATKYEEALGERGFASRAANSLSASHVLIILLIVLGNIGYYLSRRQRESI
jgi:hypothetical protein